MFSQILRQMSLRPTVMLAATALVGAACGVDKGARQDTGAEEANVGSAAEAVIVTSGPTTTSTAIGLAVQIEDGAGLPLQVRAGQTFYVNQIDMRASLQTNADEGVSGLSASGDFAGVSWAGLHLADASAEDAPNFLGKFSNRRFYRDAKWMKHASVFTFVQVDGNGAPTAAPTVINAGADKKNGDGDFFVRRMRAIQWTLDCNSRTDCTGAQTFEEEALVELRDSLHPEKTFQIQPSTTALQVVWSENPGKTYTIPVQQVASPQFDYGFTIDVIPVTDPGPDGTYAPGSDVTFEIQLRDGAGNLLHEQGTLPPFGAVAFGAETSGIQYWRGLFESFTTYYRRKHMERQLVGQIIGPAQKVGSLHSVLDFNNGDMGPDGNVYAGRPERDGFFAQGAELPSFGVIFGGLQPDLQFLWSMPVASSITFHIPPNAEAGTYLVTEKGRRVYLGQDIPASKTIEIQVGTTQHTDVPLHTGGCKDCHSGNSALSVVNHANGNRGACSACHAPLNFELEGPVYVRAHFLHSRSNRFDADVGKCSNCHLDRESIQRTSKSACLSCHTNFPQSHMDQFGALDNMYVGTEVGAFQQCTDSCHTNHPASGL